MGRGWRNAFLNGILSRGVVGVHAMIHPWFPSTIIIRDQLLHHRRSWHRINAQAYSARLEGRIRMVERDLKEEDELGMLKSLFQEILGDNEKLQFSFLSFFFSS
jgi:hypothetical protein